MDGVVGIAEQLQITTEVGIIMAVGKISIGDRNGQHWVVGHGVTVAGSEGPIEKYTAGSMRRNSRFDAVTEPSGLKERDAGFTGRNYRSLQPEVLNDGFPTSNCCKRYSGKARSRIVT
jgi:hypothetical protein